MALDCATRPGSACELRYCDSAGEMIVGPAKTLFLDEISTGAQYTPLLCSCCMHASSAASNVA